MDGLKKIFIIIAQYEANLQFRLFKAISINQLHTLKRKIPQIL